MTSTATRTCFATAQARIAGIGPNVMHQAVAATVMELKTIFRRRNCNRRDPPSPPVVTVNGDRGGEIVIRRLRSVQDWRFQPNPAIAKNQASARPVLMSKQKFRRVQQR